MNAPRATLDLDGWTDFLRRAIERMDTSRATMSPFAIAQSCMRNYIFLHASSKEQQEELLAGRLVTLTYGETHRTSRCLYDHGLRPPGWTGN